MLSTDMLSIDMLLRAAGLCAVGVCAARGRSRAGVRAIVGLGAARALVASTAYSSLSLAASADVDLGCT